MKTSDAIREVMKTEKVTQRALCGRLNLPPTTLSGRLSQDNISIDKLNEMLRVLDYKIVILPRDARIPEGGIEIE